MCYSKLEATFLTPDVLDTQATSTVLGEWHWALFSVLFFRTSFISPNIFLDDYTPSRLNTA